MPLETELEGLLQADSAGEVETINTGFPRMNTWWQLSSLRQRGLAYDPDLVLLFFVLNDVEEKLGEPGPQLEFFSDYQALYQSPDRLSSVSHLWGWARQRPWARCFWREARRASGWRCRTPAS